MKLSLIEESNFLEAQYNKLHGNFWPRHAPYAVAVINAKPFLEAQKAPCLGEPPSVVSVTSIDLAWSSLSAHTAIPPHQPLILYLAIRATLPQHRLSTALCVACMHSYCTPLRGG